MTNTKYSVLVSLLIFFLQPLSAESLDGFISRTPNIVFGEVYNVGQSYLLVEVAWELKGRLGSAIFQMELDLNSDSPSRYKTGDQLLVFVARNRIKPFEELPMADLRLSKFDEFDGQCAFMRVLIDSDYKKMSDINSKIQGRVVAAVTPD